ncbi:enzyme of poly-gamma-glutamate biosynthesis [Streptococcus pneumoniae]|nr:enzyme of poly-gamma-glutamate biosynthesis [Streptococcus pneumoniae]CJQ26842.1 enzyme of poly-gamma-glutamate biosynthesis [Streptococcus pneumoniae]
MGNFISNQRIESMGDEENAKWTERGVLMDVTIKKKDGKQLSEQLKLILLGSIEHQREPFHQKDIPCIITKLIFWKIL